MAKFNDIASNQDMVNIANAIRAVTRTTGKMTIPEMPERLWNIRVIETRDVVIDLTLPTEVSLGLYATDIKHLFIVTPSTSADVALFAKADAELALDYSEETGELKVHFQKSVPEGNQVNVKVVDMLLAEVETSSGFLVNQALGGGKTEAYDSSRAYELGETFLYQNNFGVTVSAHSAEPFNPLHNKLMTNQIWDGLSYIDLVDIAQIVSTKFDVSKVKNTHSEAQDEVYSADYANKNFAPLAFVQPYYAHVISETSASLSKTQPEPASNNVLTKQSSNTDYDWLHPDFVFTLTLDTGVVVSKSNTLMLNLAFVLSRDANISWGAKIKVSQDEGLTWTYISTAQAYGAETYDASHGNMFSLTATFDLLTELTTYGAGTKIAIEVFKKQADATSLTTAVHCGVIIDGATINTTAQLVVANVVIDTAQLKDNSVTYAKLSLGLQKVVDDSLLKPDDTPANDTLPYLDNTNTQRYATLSDNLKVENGQLCSGIVVEEVI